MAAPSRSPSLPLFLPARPGVAGSWALGVVRFPSSGGEAAARPSARRARGTAPEPGGGGGAFAASRAGRRLRFPPRGAAAALALGTEVSPGPPLGPLVPLAPWAEPGVSLPRPTCPARRSASLSAEGYGFVLVTFLSW